MKLTDSKHQRSESAHSQFKQWHRAQQQSLTITISSMLIKSTSNTSVKLSSLTFKLNETSCSTSFKTTLSTSMTSTTSFSNSSSSTSSAAAWVSLSSTRISKWMRSQRGWPRRSIEARYWVIHCNRTSTTITIRRASWIIIRESCTTSISIIAGMHSHTMTWRRLTARISLALFSTGRRSCLRLLLGVGTRTHEWEHARCNWRRLNKPSVDGRSSSWVFLPHLLKTRAHFYVQAWQLLGSGWFHTLYD